VNRNLDQVFGVNGSWLALLLPVSHKAYAPILARIIFGIFPLILFFPDRRLVLPPDDLDKLLAQNFQAHERCANPHLHT
jgi:hypothetical protein